MDGISVLQQIRSGEAKIAVLGLGHVGLPTALGLAELGWQVTGADSNAEVVRLLEAGQCPFYEPGLQELLAKHIVSPRFTLTHDVEIAIRSGSILFICVGTPQQENGAADLAQLEVLVRMTARNLNGYKLIIEKSTVPALTGQRIKRTIERYATGRLPGGADGKRPADRLPRATLDTFTPDFDVVSNPEFLQEGKALENFFHPERVVVGVDTPRAAEIVTELYRPLQCPLLVTDISTAELVKYAANAFLATKISFINMVADVCDAVGADVRIVSRGMGLDPRIGSDFLHAGIGFGGHCLPKDLRAFIHLAEEHRVHCSLLDEVGSINRRRIDVFLEKVRRAAWVLRGKTVGIWGLAFKPGTDDIREAPSLQIMEALVREGAILQLHDPQAMPKVARIFPEEVGRLSYCRSPYDAACGAHVLLLLTEWDEYGQLDLKRVRELMEVPIMVDGRNFYEPGHLRELGFEYMCMGREGVSEALPPQRKSRLPRSKVAQVTR